MYKKVILFLIFLLSLSKIQSQNNSEFNISNYYIEALNRQQGLPTNSITNICQTSDGYIWFASYDGLIRYNGNSYTFFDKSNTKFLKENGILALKEASDSTLWIASQSTDCFHIRTEKSTHTQTTIHYLNYKTFYLLTIKTEYG